MRRQDSGRLTKQPWVGQSRSWRSPGFESRARAERSLAQHLLSVQRKGFSSRAVRGWSPVVPGNSNLRARCLVPSGSSPDGMWFPSQGGSMRDAAHGPVQGLRSVDNDVDLRGRRSPTYAR